MHPFPPDRNTRTRSIRGYRMGGEGGGTAHQGRVADVDKRRLGAEADVR